MAVCAHIQFFFFVIACQPTGQVCSHSVILNLSVKLRGVNYSRLAQGYEGTLTFAMGEGHVCNFTVCVDVVYGNMMHA